MDIHCILYLITYYSGKFKKPLIIRAVRLIQNVVGVHRFPRTMCGDLRQGSARGQNCEAGWAVKGPFS